MKKIMLLLSAVLCLAALSKAQVQKKDFIDNLQYFDSSVTAQIKSNNATSKWLEQKQDSSWGQLKTKMQIQINYLKGSIDALQKKYNTETVIKTKMEVYYPQLKKMQDNYALETSDYNAVYMFVRHDLIVKKDFIDGKLNDFGATL